MWGNVFSDIAAGSNFYGEDYAWICQKYKHVEHNPAIPL